MWLRTKIMDLVLIEDNSFMRAFIWPSCRCSFFFLDFSLLAAMLRMVCRQLPSYQHVNAASKRRTTLCRQLVHLRAPAGATCADLCKAGPTRAERLEYLLIEDWIYRPYLHSRNIGGKRTSSRFSVFTRTPLSRLY